MQLTGAIVAGAASAALCAGFAAQSGPSQSIFIAFGEARPALQLLAHLVPEELKGKDPEAQRTFWPTWVEASDARIRARLAQGDEDSLVNLLLFGTSFTRQPRMTARQIETIIGGAVDPAASGARLDAITQARLDDLVRAIAQPRGNERLVFARTTLEAKGIALGTPNGQAAAKALLLHALGRVLKEFETYTRVIEQAERSTVPGSAFARRSVLYRARGLSSDTSLLPNVAVEEALKAMRAKGILASPVARVAVVGPGLDFTDKLEGYDFYPQQSLQPFAIVDSLRRLDLAPARGVLVSTLDLNPRVNAHLNALQTNARHRQPYVLQLPLDGGERWSADVLRYWTAFGDRIGSPIEPAAVPAAAGDIKLRAVRVRPDVGALLTPLDVNIVLQRLELPADEKFDLIVGTNVFLYYDEFQQALAMANIERMLRPGGVLLSNNALVELPSSRVRFAGETTLQYSDRKGDGDTIVWYKCAE